MRAVLSTKRAASFVAAIAILVATVSVAGAQRTPTASPSEVARIAKSPAVQQAFAALERENAWTIDQQISLCEIAAPPFKETKRGEAYRERLIAVGVQGVRTDNVGNIIGEIRGTRPGPTVVLSSHLDTVFPDGTNVTVRRDGTKLSAPGIGDDCRGLAVTLAAARQIVTAKIPFAGRLLIVATVGEEGAGNSRGARALFAGPLKDSIDAFISVDGTGYSITNGGVGSNRYRVSYVGPGGHSYEAFGMPNPIHAMGRAIAKIADLQATASPKVTFNVGVVSGGTSVNSIADQGVMDIDLRSESATSLAAIDAKLQLALTRALVEERARWPKSKAPLTLKIDTIGMRPAGRTPESAPIIRTALAASKSLNVSSALGSHSTDANVAMGLGVPAMTIDGGGVGDGAHSLTEWYDDRADGYKGPQWVLLIVMSLLGVK